MHAPTRVPGVIAVFAFLIACDSTEPRVPTAIQVDRQSVAVEVGDTVRIAATLLDQHGRSYDVAPQTHAITWTSSNPNVASVTGGLVRGESGGTATISVGAGTLTPVQVPVTVTARTVTMQLSFSYGGHRTGTFAVSETVRLDQPGDSWAVTFYDSQNIGQDIVAQRRRADGAYDFIHFWFDGPPITSTGPRTISDGYLILGYDADADDLEALYFFSSGGADFTHATGQRVAGAFSMGMADVETGSALSVSSGSFNIPFLSDDELAAAPGSDSAAPLAQTLHTVLQRSDLRARSGAR
jgi:hypothetical protein